MLCVSNSAASKVFNPIQPFYTGLRYGEVTGYEDVHMHDDHMHASRVRLKETEVMLTWHASHFSYVRLQYTNQTGSNYALADDNVITLQYNVSLGAHDAHAF